MWKKVTITSRSSPWCYAPKFHFYGLLIIHLIIVGYNCNNYINYDSEFSNSQIMHKPTLLGIARWLVQGEGNKKAKDSRQKQIEAEDCLRRLPSSMIKLQMDSLQHAMSCANQCPRLNPMLTTIYFQACLFITFHCLRLMPDASYHFQAYLLANDTTITVITGIFHRLNKHLIGFKESKHTRLSSFANVVPSL